MKILHSLPLSTQPPVAITIGNFDGVHLGHKKVFEILRSRASEHHLPTCAITFSNHPTTVLTHSTPPPLICTQEHKEHLLKDAGIDLLYMIPFTKDIAEQTPEEFIKALRKVQPFDIMVLGSDATIGKDRMGTQEVLFDLAKRYGFALEYVPDELQEGQRISSRRIRECIQKGELNEASLLLGRPYSILGMVVEGSGRGAGMGFHTANVVVDGLCLPPLGVYAVIVHYRGHSYKGVANLGKAPTIRNAENPLLEVHLFDEKMDLYGHTVDVEFRQYMRPEKRFGSVEDLKTQIAHDVQTARSLLG